MHSLSLDWAFRPALTWVHFLGGLDCNGHVSSQEGPIRAWKSLDPMHSFKIILRTEEWLLSRSGQQTQNSYHPLFSGRKGDLSRNQRKIKLFETISGVSKWCYQGEFIFRVITICICCHSIIVNYHYNNAFMGIPDLGMVFISMYVFLWLFHSF